MPFADLTSKPLADFIENNRLGDELLVFIHIPKTAGSSFSAELSRQRRPYTNIHVTYSGDDRISVSRIEDSIEAFVGGSKGAEARSCSGHFNWRQAAVLRQARPDARFISFLRNPVKRVISDYRYARTPIHPTYRDFIDAFPDIESYVTSRGSQNKMANALLPQLNMERTEIERHLDENYLFVGLLEMYPMSFNIISRLMGGRATPSEHKRKTMETGDNALEESDALRQMIRVANPKDMLLYEIVHKRLIEKRAEWQQLSAAMARGGRAASA